MKRRNFIIGSLSGIAAASVASTPILSSCCTAPKEKKQETPLNLCLQEGVALGDSLEEKLDFMEAHGVTGLEVGGGNLKSRVEEINKALQGRNIKASAICAGFSGFILAEDEQKQQFDTTMREIVEAAGQIGSCGVIMVPAFNGQNPCKPHTMDTRNYLCEQLHELGEFALKCGTTVILEP
ncbi:MAG: sugar phosphate isomerase/epimerase family protein, partial [Bacteroidaceae bacterium]